MAGKRHQRMEETRVHALREAVKLFLTQGYNNTTVSQIADRIDRSPAALLRAYPDKILCDCGATYIVSEPHSMQEADGKTYCFYCEYEDTSAHTHAWSTAWTNNDTHHWHECTADGCDVTDDSSKDGYVEHSYSDDSDATCDCGTEYHKHVYAPATCAAPMTCQEIKD